MSKNINLLPQRKNNFRQEKSLSLAKRIAVICLVITVAAVVVTFVLNLDTTFLSLKGEENYAKTNLTLLQEKTLRVYLLKQRLQDIKNIFAKRYTYESNIDQIKSQLPVPMNLDSVQISDQKITMTASSSSLNALDTFLNTIINMFHNKKLLKTLTISTISADKQTQQYTLTIEGDLL